MNAPAFVLAAAPSHAVLTARPWLCGTRIATAPRLPTRSRLPSRIFACTPPPADEPAAAEEDVPLAAPGPDAADDAAPEDVAETPVSEAGAEEAADGGSDDAAAGADDQKRKKRRRARKREVTLPLEDIVVGQELEGVVRSVTDYGAFIGDMGTPTDGLLHVSQLAAGFVENVTDIVNVGDKVTVRVLGVDTAKGNFSLTMKTATELEERRSGGDGKKNRKDDKREKWNKFKFDPKEFVDARVTSVTEFGAFCQFLNESGEVLESAPTEGLIHISEISENRVNNVSDVLSVGQDVKVRVLATDRKRNRISMSLKQFSEDDNESSKSDIAADMEKAQSNQPTFKTSFELAFERAKASSSQ